MYPLSHFSSKPVITPLFNTRLIHEKLGISPKLFSVVQSKPLRHSITCNSKEKIILVTSTESKKDSKLKEESNCKVNKPVKILEEGEEEEAEEESGFLMKFIKKTVLLRATKLFKKNSNFVLIVVCVCGGGV